MNKEELTEHLELIGYNVYVEKLTDEQILEKLPTIPKNTLKKMITLVKATPALYDPVSRKD